VCYLVDMKKLMVGLLAFTLLAPLPAQADEPQRHKIMKVIKACKATNWEGNLTLRNGRVIDCKKVYKKVLVRAEKRNK
jgi:hypothetical protein